MQIVSNILETQSYIIEGSEEFKGIVAQTSYTLPDRSEITLGSEKWNAPEILFNSDKIESQYQSVTSMIYEAIMTCDVELRLSLYKSIYTFGGMCKIPGFAKRVVKEISRSISSMAAPKIMEQAESPADLCAYASIGVLDSLGAMWITKNVSLLYRNSKKGRSRLSCAAYKYYIIKHSHLVILMKILNINAYHSGVTRHDMPLLLWSDIYATAI